MFRKEKTLSVYREVVDYLWELYDRYDMISGIDVEIARHVQVPLGQSQPSLRIY